MPLSSTPTIAKDNVRSRWVGERVLALSTWFIGGRLRLPNNTAKCPLDHPRKHSFMSFTMVAYKLVHLRVARL